MHPSDQTIPLTIHDKNIKIRSGKLGSGRLGNSRTLQSCLSNNGKWTEKFRMYDEIENIKSQKALFCTLYNLQAMQRL